MRRRDLSKLLAATATGVALGPETAAAQTPAATFARTTVESAIGVTPTNYAFPPGNVLRHGADPTGAANSNRAFTDAIRVATAAETGGIVTIPPGIYSYSSGFAWNAPNVTIIGTGTWDSNQMPRQPAPTTLRYTGTADAITVGSPYKDSNSTAYGGSYFSSFKLQGTPAATNGMHLYYSTTAKLERMLVRDFVRPGASGIYADNRWQDITSLDWIEFTQNYTGLTLAAVNDSTDVNNCEFQYHTGPAVVLGQISPGTTSHVVNFKNCQWAFNGSSLPSGPADVEILSGNTINFISCYFENGLTAALANVVVGDLTGSSQSTIVRNVNFIGCFFQGGKVNNYAVQVANSRVFNLNFHGCTFLNFVAAAIDNSRISGSQGSIYVDPSCSLNGTPAFFASNSLAAGVAYSVPAAVAVFQNSVQLGPGGSAVKYLRILTATASSFTAIRPNATQTQTIAVEGVAPTDVSFAMPSRDLQSGLVVGSVSVSGANSIDVQLANVSAEPITPTPLTLTFVVIGQ